MRKDTGVRGLQIRFRRNEQKKRGYQQTKLYFYSPKRRKKRRTIKSRKREGGPKRPPGINSSREYYWHPTSFLNNISLKLLDSELHLFAGEQT